MNLSQRFETTLKTEGLIRPGDKVFVACSGGPDSVALFHLLAHLPKSWNLRLGLLHLNHGLRGRAADRDEAYVEALGREFDVPVYTGKRKVRCRTKGNRFSVEEAAREVRYRFLEKMARRYRIPKIALAHTVDDQAETILMRVLQGTGLRGLSGIREKIQRGKVWFVRPLLDFSKKELVVYLKKGKVSYRKDQTNQSQRFFRNRIRNKLLPRLEREFNPNITRTLARIPVIVREENELLASLEEESFRRVLKQVRRDRIFLKRDAFSKLSRALQFRVLSKVLGRLDARSGLNFAVWQQLKPNLCRPRFRYSLQKDIDIALTPHKMVLYKKYAKGR